MNIFKNKKIKKSELYACIGTAVSGIIMLLILFFVMLPGLKNKEDEGIMISFGNFAEGSGATETENQHSSQSATPKSETKEVLLTQQDKSVIIPQETKKKPKKKPVQENDRLKKEQEAIQQADKLIGSSFGTGNNSRSGHTTGEETAGNPVGKGTEGGNSWSLYGRELLGTMPIPEYNQDTEGYLMIEIRVDADGNVTYANVRKGTISIPSLREAALNAARKTRFSSGNGTVTGTITYKFKIK